MNTQYATYIKKNYRIFMPNLRNKNNPRNLDDFRRICYLLLSIRLNVDKANTFSDKKAEVKRKIIFSPFAIKKHHSKKKGYLGILYIMITQVFRF